MRAAKDPRLLRTEASDTKKTQGLRREKEEHLPTDSSKEPSTLDAPPAPSVPASAEEGIAMEDDQFL